MSLSRASVKVRIILIIDGRFDDCTPEFMQRDDRVDNYH